MLGVHKYLLLCTHRLRKPVKQPGRPGPVFNDRYPFMYQSQKSLLAVLSSTRDFFGGIFVCMYSLGSYFIREVTNSLEKGTTGSGCGKSSFARMQKRWLGMYLIAANISCNKEMFGLM